MKGNPVYGVQPTNRLRDDIFASSVNAVFQNDGRRLFK